MTRTPETTTKATTMCNEHNFDPNNPFADLDDSDFDNAPVREERVSNPHVEKIGNTEIPGFVEDCPKCRGTGNWRPGYKCFKCKGTGKLQFKTSPAARAASRKSAQARKRKVAEQNLEAGLASLDEDVRDWLKAGVDKGNQFAVSLTAGLIKYGSLTDGQINGVRKAIARDCDTQAGVEEWAENHEAEYEWLKSEDKVGNEFAGSLLGALKRYGSLTEGQLNAVRRNLDKVKDFAPSDLDISSLKGYYAVPDGDTRLKLCVRKPGKNSRYHGWTFVDDGSAYGQRTTYGKQAPEGTYQGKVQDALRAILENPLEAQKAYGHLTGVCGRCGRILEDEESVAAGIGPVCATKI